MNARRLAFVAGATGYTGQAIVAHLCALSIDTVAHVRPDSSRLAEWRARFQALGARVDTTPWRISDRATDASGVSKAMETLDEVCSETRNDIDGAGMSATFRALHPTHVFAALGTTLARSRRGSDSSIPDTYADVDLALTQILIDASVAAGSVERFAYISATGANEGTRNPYLKVRVEVERLIRASGLGYTIARPGFVSGLDREENRPLERIGARTSDIFFTLASSLGARGFAARYRSISGPVLARGLVHAAFDPHCKDRSLHALDLRRAGAALF